MRSRSTRDIASSILLPTVIDLDRYADLIVRVGANVQPGQTLFVNAAPEHAELVRAVARSAYRAGARYVDVRYTDLHVRKAMIDLAPEETLTTSPGWLLDRADDLDGNALIMIAGDPEPELLASSDPARVGRALPRELAKRQLAAQGARRVAWAIAAYAMAGQAELMFGEPDVDRLWESIAYTVRLDEDDPVAAWQAHCARLRGRARALDALELDAVHFAGPGTELTVGLMPESRWLGGGLEAASGVFHVPNLPTEEVFTTPDWRRTEGTVRSTRPLALAGTIVRDLELTFERGEAVDVRASSGADAVRGQLAIDEFANRLGEVALVDGTSRVGETGLTFFDTLFDENATCHVAYGAGVLLGMPDLDGLEPDKLRARGANVSAMHTDFMVGGPEVEVDGVTRDGRRIPILREDVWQLS